MKPESVDDGSLEKLAEKAAGTIWTWNKIPYTEIKRIILSALSEATAALEEKIKKQGDAATWIIADPASIKLSEASQRFLQSMRLDGENIYNDLRARIKELESAKATTPTPVLQVSQTEESANATTRSPRDENSKSTEQATRRLRVAMEHPTWETDFTPPLAQVIENVRSSITQTRENLNDIMSAFPPWRERFDHVAGLLTCGLVALADSKEEIAGFEVKHGSLTDRARESYQGVEKVGDKQPRTMAQKKHKRISDEDVYAWAVRHDIQGSMLYLRTAFEDARTLSL